jgi:hypothetical protein
MPETAKASPIAGMAIRQTLKADRYTEVPIAGSRSLRM